MPEGERVRRAVRWVSAEIQEDPSRSPLSLAHEAVLRFDLTPKESEELLRFYRAVRERQRESRSGPEDSDR